LIGKRGQDAFTIREGANMTGFFTLSLQQPDGSYLTFKSTTNVGAFPWDALQVSQFGEHWDLVDSNSATRYVVQSRQVDYVGGIWLWLNRAPSSTFNTDSPDVSEIEPRPQPKRPATRKRQRELVH
jgi:hypothetical protein